jgi:hypothetical protein
MSNTTLKAIDKAITQLRKAIMQPLSNDERYQVVKAFNVLMDLKQGAK